MNLVKVPGVSGTGSHVTRTALLLAGLALAGCGGAAESQPPPVKGVVRYCSTDSYQTESAAAARFNRIHAPRGLSVRLVVLRDYRRLGRALKANRCDVAELSIEELGGYAAAGGLRDLTAQLQPRRHEFFPGALAAVHYAKRDWGVPLWLDVGLLFARTETLPATLQDVYRHGGFVYGDGPDTPLAFLETAYAAGGRVLTPDGRHSALDSPENRRALSLMLSAVRRGKLRGGSGFAAYRRYMDGDATYMRNWSTAVPQGLDEDLPDDVHITPLPPFAGGRAVTLMVGSDLVVPRGSRNVRGALAFIGDRVSVAGARPAARGGQLSPLVKSYDDFALTETPGGPALKGALLRAVPPPVTPHEEELAQAIGLAVHEVLTGASASTGRSARPRGRSTRCSPRTRPGTSFKVG